MSSSTVHCRICSGNFGSRSAWLEHLLQEDGHLHLARKNWERSEVNSEERACALVVYGKVPVGKDDRVIRYLSQVEFGVMVTDFVWWEGRPTVGVVQLESGDAVKKVMSRLTNGEFRIEPDQVCRVMEGSKVEDLEWKNILHGHGTDLNGSELNRKETRTPTPCSQDDIGTAPGTLLTDDTSSSNGNGSTNLLEVSGETKIDAPVMTMTSEPPPSNVVPSGFKTDLGLQHHLRTILELIQVPNEEYDTALEIHRQIQQVLHNGQWGTGSRETISFDAVLTRNWLLKLQYNRKPSGHLELSFLLLKDRMDANKCFDLFPKDCKRIEKMLIKKERGGKRSFLSCEIVNRVESYCGRFSEVFTLKEPSTNLQFDVHITSNYLYFGEYQIWRLVQYLLTFDPHCYPVLAAAYYWASINSVLVGGKRGSHDDLRDPSALNWLMVIFFQKEGRIPTAKEVLERPHPAKYFLQRDIGFSDCSRYALAWRKERNTFEVDTTTEEFAKEVFTLLQKFFLFCGALVGDNDNGGGDWGWILNTRDGEIIPKAEVLSSERPKEDWKLTTLELNDVKESLKGSEASHRIIMLQPFFLNWRISTWNTEAALVAMKETWVAKLEKLEWEEFLKMLKLQEEFVPLPESLEKPFKRSLDPIGHAKADRKKRKLENKAEALGLENHLKYIQKLTQPPCEDSAAAREITVRLQEALIEKNENKVMKVAMCDHQWILNLQEPTVTKEGSNPVLSLVIYEEEEQPDGSYKANSQQLEDVEGSFVTKSQGELEGGTPKPYFLSNEILSMSKEQGVLNYNVKLVTGGLFEVKILSNPTQLVQAQTIRFIKYLFGFDPCCSPVLGLTYYWAKVNSIFGVDSDIDDGSMSMGLSLLLMLFLQNEGLIPTADRVLERPHKRLFFDEVDIGFAENPHFAMSWKNSNSGKNKKFRIKEEESEDGDMFAERAFILLYKFFLFCASHFGEGDVVKEERGWILNNRESKILPMRGRGSSTELKGKTRMTCDDNEGAKESPEEENHDKLIMFHPFFVDKKIPMTLTKEAFVGMKKTGMKLKEYFEGDGVGGKREKLELEEFLNLFKI